MLLSILNNMGVQPSMKQLTRLVKQVVIKKFQWQEMKIRGKWPKSCFLIPQLHILPRLKESGLNSGLGGCFFEFGEDRAKEPEAMEKEWDLVTLSDGKIEVTEEQSAGSELCPREEETKGARALEEKTGKPESANRGEKAASTDERDITEELN
ncbi:hypothetical protein MRB53_036264 [Persea americana]|nr:hypothetical protein MRB53_036700 [Persea americana]KAJ8614776.1 hypothetical protein MRB53_036442 [Persea americana]KAJ8614851.1 hypothetical protein MRB53_036264 [Persea americana]